MPALLVQLVHDCWRCCLDGTKKHTDEASLSSQVVDFLGSAAFSKAVQAIDLKTGGLVCLKIVKVRRPTDCTMNDGNLL